MSIRLGNSCMNCEKFDKNFCRQHDVSVGHQHTCDSFHMREAIKNEPNCLNCQRYQGPTCANPQKAAPGMLCNHWAPTASA
ncbi:MAG: hypothetical protein VX712_09025 [Bacteroidota bacterium]|uniref:hypothetical protein n=1 Tax=Christiangramia sp. TaxID=1931228 RepID=UPI000C6BE247|nr:hypothetical protein [Christiangramia sp.]MEE2772347.1 hypothetical protein [Bacteroidota bacterium]